MLVSPETSHKKIRTLSDTLSPAALCHKLEYCLLQTFKQNTERNLDGSLEYFHEHFVRGDYYARQQHYFVHTWN